MRAADQYVPRHVVEQGVGFEAPSVFVYLSRVAVAQLRVVGLKVSAYFLARLLEADGAVGFSDATGPIHRYQDVFVYFRHMILETVSSGSRGGRRHSRHRRCARFSAALH